MKSLAAQSPRRVESRQNARIKELRAALERGRTPYIALEGLHLVQEAVQSGLQLHTIFVRAGEEALLDRLAFTPQRNGKLTLLHPEWRFGDDALSSAIFRAFGDAARARMASRRG